MITLFVLTLSLSGAPEVDTIGADYAERHDGRASWAFTPPLAVEPPSVADTSWPRGEIDRFILSRLEAHGLAPAPDADRRTIMRRLHNDLLGLPASVDSIETFVHDDATGALERLVDRLLGSRHFGERWARRWLDVARYADSTGGGRTRALDNAWRYRDYVISSFNRDKPFDRFIREQLAGDLLPWKTHEERRDNLIATAFLVLGPHNYENQDKDLLRMDVVDEQISTTGRAFLAMTLDCARCHDHKFDPIPTRDYYALGGIFRSTKTLTPGNVSGFFERPLPVADELAARLDEHARAVREIEVQLTKVRQTIKTLQPQGEKADARAVAATEIPGIVIDDVDAMRTGRWTASTSVGSFVGAGYIHDGNTDKGSKSVTFSPEIPRAGVYEVRIAYAAATNRASAAPVTVRHADGEKTLRIDQRRAPPIDGLFVSLGRFRFEKGNTGSVCIVNDATKAHVIADAAQFIPVELLSSESPPKPAAETATRDDAERARLAEAQAERARLEKELKELRGKAPERPITMAVEDEKVTEDWHIHLRGEIRNLGDKVPRGFLSAIATSAPTIPESESGRRELAEWIASANNPLTARVVVNRAWHWLVGSGLVRTVDNFGTTGEAPSHPELLDWLARRFIAENWSLKWLVREIALSRTYGLASRPTRQAAEVDPENRLVSHANRKRLDAESLRDALLFFSGELDLTPGGPSITAGAGKKAGNKVEYGYRYTTKRRSVYVPIFRNTLYELFEVFDFADPNLVVGRRANTTRSTQALYLLNSPFLMERARRTAERLLAESSLDDAGKIELAFRRILGRPPSQNERQLALQFVADPDPSNLQSGHGAERRLAVWAAWIQTLFTCIDFRLLN